VRKVRGIVGTTGKRGKRDYEGVGKDRIGKGGKKRGGGGGELLRRNSWVRGPNGLRAGEREQRG